MGTGAAVDATYQRLRQPPPRCRPMELSHATRSGMKLARSLLASAVVLALAACGNDPVSVDGRTGPGSLRATVSADTTIVDISDTDLNGADSTDSTCIVTQVNADGTTTTINVCTDGPYTGGGG